MVTVLAIAKVIQFIRAMMWITIVIAIAIMSVNPSAISSYFQVIRFHFDVLILLQVLYDAYDYHNRVSELLIMQIYFITSLKSVMAENS